MKTRISSGRAGLSALHPALWGLVVLIVACFLFGGASRDDVQSLALLRPLAFVLCILGAVTISREQLHAFRFEFLFLLATAILLLVHMVPLPPALWQALPGRQLIVDIDSAAAVGEVWRPISIAPARAWNAFYSLSVPTACLLLGSQLNLDQSKLLLRVVIVTGLLSALWGILQLVGPSGLYTYSVRTEGTPVGLFANRNHQALALAMLIPMLAVWASGGARTELGWRVRVTLAAISCLLLVPVIIATGSRAGLVFLAMGAGAAPFLFHSSRPATRRRGNSTNKLFIAACGFVAVSMMAALAAIMLRADAFQRLADGDRASEMRLLVWGPLAEIGAKYFPFGSGSGSLVEAYLIDEPRELLGPFYLNHAHNEYIEIFVTLGLPGVLLLIVGMIWLAKAAILARKTNARSDSGRYIRLSVVMVLMMAAASLVDYPLRTPYCLALFAISVVWLRLVMLAPGTAGSETS